MTFGQRVVRLFVWGAVALLGISLLANGWHAVSGGLFVAGGLIGVVATTWAPRAESAGGTEE